MSTPCSFALSFDWLFVCLRFLFRYGWLVSWLVGRSVGWWVGWLSVWFVGWLFGWLWSVPYTISRIFSWLAFIVLSQKICLQHVWYIVENGSIELKNLINPLHHIVDTVFFWPVDRVAG